MKLFKKKAIDGEFKKNSIFEKKHIFNVLFGEDLKI